LGALPNPHCVSSNYIIATDPVRRRFLIFDRTKPNSAAIAVVGRASPTTPCPNESCVNTIAAPDNIGSASGCAVDAAGRLYLTDSTFNRVLVYNQIPQTSGVAADYFLGQDTGTGQTANTGATGDLKLKGPSAVWANSDRLFVADSGNNRVLAYHLPITANHQAAEYVLGQADFNGVAAATTNTGMSSPRGVTSDGQKLVVTDGGNNRVLVYASIPSGAGASGTAADYVLGQPDFSSNTAGTFATLQTFSIGGAGADQPALFNNSLFIIDYGFALVLEFDLTTITNGMHPKRYYPSIRGPVGVQVDAKSISITASSDARVIDMPLSDFRKHGFDAP
jgi:hypothetical protein